MIKIHDIKPNVEIPDFTIYLYYGLILFTMIIVSFLIYFIYKFISTKYFNNKHSNEKKYYKILKELDFENTKNTAYAISKYGRLLAKTQRELDLIDDLNHQLEIYKYKKDVPSDLSKEIKVKYETFMEALDVR